MKVYGQQSSNPGYALSLRCMRKNNESRLSFRHSLSTFMAKVSSLLAHKREFRAKNCDILLVHKA